MLNAQELIDRKIITGRIDEDNIAQHGIDLNVIKIESLNGIGYIPYKGKTKLVEYIPVPVKNITNANFDESVIPEVEVWELQSGTYSVTFEQGCDIPNDQMLLIRQRSSLLRNGTILHSSVFDAGFKTDNIGTIMIVTQPIRIERGARIAQIYNHQCYRIENLYDGQWQGDKQRK